MWESKMVECPFYIEEDKRTITCEGAVSMRCIQQFKTHLEKENQKYSYCNACYKQCTHFQAVEKKY